LLEEDEKWCGDQDVPQRIILLCSTDGNDSIKKSNIIKNLNWDGDVIGEYNDMALEGKMEE
jgi:hypothetical protein